MKVHIAFDFSKYPHGGGSRFLTTLRGEWRRQGVYSESASTADAIVFNSHNSLLHVARLVVRYPEKVFIHRVDGPMSLYTERSDARDRRAKWAARILARGVVFQSQWSRRENLSLGLVSTSKPFAVILNAPDPKIFYAAPRIAPRKKIKLIATSWSANLNKGFTTLQWLDENLNWNQYEMTFVGRGPVRFQNIFSTRVRNPRQLAALLRTHDIFVFPSRVEACSNALLEALACGLPALAYAGTSNAEVVREGGAYFQREAEIPALLDTLVGEWQQYRDAISTPPLPQTAREYLSFAALF